MGINPHSGGEGRTEFGSTDACARLHFHQFGSLRNDACVVGEENTAVTFVKYYFEVSVKETLIIGRPRIIVTLADFDTLLPTSFDTLLSPHRESKQKSFYGWKKLSDRKKRGCGGYGMNVIVS